MPKISTFGVVCLLLALFAFPAAAAEVRDPDQHFFTLNIGDFKADLADARANRKHGVLIMFEQEGCPGCLYMKQNVLNRRDVQDYYRANFVTLSVDIHGAIGVRDFAGREGTEKAYAQNANIRGTPTFVFYDLEGNEVARYFGPVETAQEFMLLGRFVASGAYKTRSFARYKQENPIRKGT
jgi:thioredoxin-related protein